MNDLNPSSPAPSEDVAEQVSCLRRQVFTLLVALIVVSGTLTVFLYRQSSLLGHDIASVKLQAGPIITSFNQNRAGMEVFMQQLGAYAATHPDFQPVLKKYGWVPPAATAAPAEPKK